MAAFECSRASGRGSGSTSIPAGARLAADDGFNSKILDTRTLNIAGTATTFRSGVSSFATLLQNGATINNSGSFDVQADTDWGHSGGAATTFNNTGTFTKSGGSSGDSIFSSIAFNNSGTVNVLTGTLSLAGGKYQLRRFQYLGTCHA